MTDADVTLTDKPVTINWNNFAAKRANLEQVGTTATVTDGTVTFHGLDIGAYYVYAQSDKTSYNPMGEAVYTYDENTGLMKPAVKQSMPKVLHIHLQKLSQAKTEQPHTR